MDDNALTVPRVNAGDQWAGVGERLAFRPLSPLWGEEYPYRPECEFALAWCANAQGAESILAFFRVHEQCLRAEAAEDGGAVWEDSCCELFLAPDGEGYYNIECNCAGTLLLAYGPGRKPRQQAPRETMALIRRQTSLSDKHIPRQEGDFSWTLALSIPTAAFFKHQPMGSLAGQTWRGNIYKCGDKTIPHFLAYSPIGVPSPDFHRPEAFTPIRFAAEAAKGTADNI